MIPGIDNDFDYDDDCEGDDEFEEADDTVSTFGQLPPAPPPRIITHPEIGEQIEKLFAKYAGAKMNMPFVVSMVLQSLNIQPRDYKDSDEQVRDYLFTNSQPGGWLSMTKGKSGGICKVGDRIKGDIAPPSYTQNGPHIRPGRATEVVPIKRNEKPCRNCGRNNDIGVHKCWNCECSSP